MQDRFDRSVASQPDDPFAFACVMSELRFGMKYFVEQEGAEEVAAMEARLALKLNPPSGLREVEDVAIQETGDNCADDGHNATARLRDKVSRAGRSFVYDSVLS